MSKWVGSFLLLGAVLLSPRYSHADAQASQTGTWSIVSEANIDFSTSGARLTDREQKTLSAIANTLAADTTLKVSIEGYADSMGTTKDNQAVSAARANTVAKALTALGIDSARFTEVAGDGASKPLGDNATEAGRRKNRRVEVRVLSSGPAAKTSVEATPAATAEATPAATAEATPEAAAQEQATAYAPQLFLNIDGSLGARVEPNDSGHGIGGVSGGLEYIPSYMQYLGLDVDYNYLAIAKPTDHRDNDVDLSLRGIFFKDSTLSVWLQAGVGYNTTTNSLNTHYAAFVQPGVRWAILPRLALDGGVQYLVASPSNNVMQAVSLVLGLTVPLDGSYKVTVFGN